MQLHRSSTATWLFRPASSSAAARPLPPQRRRAPPPLPLPRCAAPAQPEAQVAEPLSVSIPTADARSCIRFAVVPSGTGQAIAVQAVAEGSSAEEAGVVRGMRLRGISDPVRRDEVWELQDRPSLRYVRDVLRMRAAPFIELRFEAAATPEVLAALQAAEGTVPLAAATASSNTSSSSSSSSSSSPADSPLSSLASMSEAGAGETIAERLQQQYAASQAGGKAMSAVEQREARRRERMELDSARNDSGFFAIVAAAFLLPALVILGVAYGTGYLDSLYLNTLSARP